MVSLSSSQLPQSRSEGLALCGALVLFRKAAETGWQNSRLFAWIVRQTQWFVSEYTREPDAFLGLQALGLLRGQGAEAYLRR